MNQTENIEAQLREQGFYVSTTVGCSMFPMLRNRRDRVVVLPVGPERLRKYDLPLYRRPDGKYILHRIIGVRPGEYIIRGDNTYAKEHVPDSWILGYVSEFYRGRRHMRTSDRGYRVYAAVWNALYPLRRVFVFAKRAAGAVWRRLRGRRHRKDGD